MDKIEFIRGGRELLNDARPLWESLNRHHESKSPYFAERYKNFTFEKRAEKFMEKNDGFINIDMIKKDDVYVGYCITTISSNKEGEIESLFLLNSCRGHGYGDMLMERAVEWLDNNGAVKKIIGVAAGNEDVLEFYKRHGFYKKTIILEQIN